MQYQYRGAVVALCLCLAACVEGPVTFNVPPLDGPAVVINGAAGGAAPSASSASSVKSSATAAGSSAPRTVARTVAAQPETIADDTTADNDAGVAVAGAGGSSGSSAPMAGAGGIGGAGGSSAPMAGAGGIGGAAASSSPMAGAGGAGGTTAEPVPDYPATRCQVLNTIVDCSPTWRQYHPDWDLFWFVGHAIPDGVSGVDYGCNKGSPACVRGAECDVAIIGSNQPPAVGVCL